MWPAIANLNSDISRDFARTERPKEPTYPNVPPRRPRTPIATRAVAQVVAETLRRLADRIDPPCHRLVIPRQRLARDR